MGVKLGRFPDRIHGTGFEPLLIFTADFGDPLHRLVFLAACLVYGTLGFGLIALGAHVNTGNQRILKAIEALAGEGRTPSGGAAPV